MSANPREPVLESRCAAMRRSFDEAFAHPAAGTAEPVVDLLALRAGGDAYALRLAEIAGLHVNLHVVPLPNPAPHLLGIVANRGVMAPVYDLAGILGYPPAASSRWIAMVRAPQLLGLALECFETHLRVPNTFVGINERADGAGNHRHAREAVQAGGALRPILQVAALIKSVQERSHDR